MLWTCYAASLAMLYWIYDGYGRFLLGLVRLSRMNRPSAGSPPVTTLPFLTVLLTVHNEEDCVAARVEDLLACSYPADRLQILVASDGSTDQTSRIVRSLAATDDRIRLLETPGLGKTATQNRALQEIASDVVVFTDADIRFDPMFLQRVAERFADSSIGAVDGRLMYGDGSNDALAEGQGYYWRYEHRLRLCESELGLLAVVAGACFAARRALLRPMDPSIGEDCIVPLDVVSQGFRVVHEPQAVAWDRFDEGNAFAFRRRIRMTLRNWQGTWTRPRLLNPLRHPGYAVALWSHKLLRWLSPVFLLTAMISSGVLVVAEPGWVAACAGLPLLGLVVLAVFGWFAPRWGLRIPGAGTAFSFALANLAFLVGVMRAMTGHRVQRYRKVAAP